VKHTPGPWTLDEPRDSKIGLGRWICSGDEYVARVNLNENEKRRNADAHLIAAAPDLLDAVELALQAIEGSAATDYGDVAALRRDDRGQWADAVEALRRARTKSKRGRK